jgi:CRP/FNR family transcriptional regulator, cyclic AMP receptor protein
MASPALILSDIPIFQLLDDNEREALVPLLEGEFFQKGQTIYHYGDPGDRIYIVRRGKVQTYVENDEGARLIVSEPCDGDPFGEVSFLDGGPRTSTAYALEDTEVLSLTRERLLEFVDHHSHAALDLLTVMGQRWRKTDALLRKHIVQNVNTIAEERMTFGQRVADRVATFGGSWTFIIGFFALLLSWMGVNTWFLRHRAFDPYPYILLNLVLSCLAAIQAPIIMMSQNRQASKDRLQADQDYAVNLRAELEVAHLHKKMDHLYEVVRAAIDKRDRSERDYGRMT